MTDRWQARAVRGRPRWPLLLGLALVAVTALPLGLLRAPSARAADSAPVLRLTGHMAPAPETRARAAERPEFFGVVGRDPSLSLDVDGGPLGNGTPRQFLNALADEYVRLGVRWVRVEFRARPTSATGPGEIAFENYDAFIREVAPSRGLKVLALLNSGLVTDNDPYYWLPRLEDPPDGAGGDPADRSNNYIRVFAEKAAVIADRYGDAIAAYELFNEPNVNTHKYMLSQGAAHEVDAERFATLATATSLAIRGRHPSATLVLGGLLHGHPVERPERTPSDYLADVYRAPRVQWFFRARPQGADRVFPWDAVGLHPYGLSPADVETHVREVKARMGSVGDGGGKIWVTELGLQAEPPPIRSTWLMPPSPQEMEQAEFLLDCYTRLLAMPEVVERVFWFKFEDFREQGAERNWGLVRLREDARGRYAPASQAYPRKPAYAVLQAMANPSELPMTPRPWEAGNPRYFGETKQTVPAPFWRFWAANGGLARFGYPRTAAFWQGGVLVQYFERARFEYRPELARSGNDVQLGLLGTILAESETRLAARVVQAPPPESVPPRATVLYFPETRNSIANGFRVYWERNGGRRIFGLPISGEVTETNPADGRARVVQYFERARFEWHPELAGTAFEVQLGLIGNEILEERFWYR